MALPKFRTSMNSGLNLQMMMPKAAALFTVLAMCVFAAGARAQSRDRVPQSFDPTPSAVLQGHHPQWAATTNDVGAVDSNKAFENVTVTLARSPEVQRAFDQLVEDQRNPLSPQYHHWLTPIEIGAQYGVSDNDIAQVKGWLESQGLHVNLVSPTRTFVSFGGTAGNLERAFGAELHNYKVNGEDRFSIASEPRVPSALAPVILSIRGLSSPLERPQHVSHQSVLPKPDTYLGTNFNVVGPADFAVIYDTPSSLTGAGVTIGIVGEARVAASDIAALNSLMGTSMSTATEVIPTAYGGVDPGAAYSSEPSCYAANPNTCSAAENDYLDDQGEATLDEERSGTVAQGASILLVTASSGSGGIADDAEYLTETTPAPAQIMSISFGGCEANATGAVSGWSSLYQNAAAEGISVFVSSGDSGAAGCDAHGGAPPATPGPVSPNFLCSPIYETCVGGTEFNDASNYSSYWNTSNGAGLVSAKSYIPEGAWNDPGTSGAYTIGATGGGVSSVIATPSWQTGTGVPSARAGRYTPDVSFTASADHDGYLTCMAAIGGDCGSGYIEIFGGTSASAPDMAGVAALLDQKMGAAQGNITPDIYTLASSSPAAFHDVTVSSSGVSGCAVGTPSMCNNSVPGTTLTNGTQGYLVGTGYDETTGLGSLDIATFINDYYALSTSSPTTPTVTVSPTTNPIVFNQSLMVNVTVSGGSGTATGSVKLTSGSYSSSSTTLSSGGASITIPASSLAVGTDTLTVTYTPDSGSSSIYTSASGTASETVNKASQTITFTNPGAQTYGQMLTLSATASSGLTVTYSSITGSRCTVSGNKATFVGTGTCTIYAEQAGNADYTTAAEVPQSFTVNKASQTITFTNPGAQTYGKTLTLGATSTSGLAIMYSSITGSKCTVSGNVASFVGTGTCTIYAEQTGNANYLAAAEVPQSFTINKASQTITFTNPGTQTYGTKLTLSATSTSGLAITYSSITGSRCTISGNVATFVATGTCTIYAEQAGNVDYLAATEVPQSFTVGKASQTITFSNPGTQKVGTPLTLSATASSGLTVIYSSITGSMCTVSGNTATFLKAGTCTIYAEQTGNVDYSAAPEVPQSFTVTSN